ncbi:hypothetical protein Leryth_006186 [Lithospermum erythrorhizon]|nr:hypothetical protein Leryth_006186 [Lithospermum erythrorhizon]
MSSMLSSQCLVLATAMAVSAGTLIILDHLWQKSPLSTNSALPRNQDAQPIHQTLPKSCFSSGSKKRDTKKKKVKFADDVKDSSGNGEEYRKEHNKVRMIQKSGCGNEILDFPGMQANRKALYDGMLKARFQRMELSF